ncbi:Ig-like domain-containing protein [Micromonospora sp. KC723]|uniref:Ig-like domain-containing protein n=1 Tax=Micromonospora sp. KC723 TaxID=2530381 RepID=UPI0021109E6D|nr:Ig-like domain-containing protein [Micromonospora sp. KC723]
MKTINDIPDNAGTGVWPWAGTSVFGTGRVQTARCGPRSRFGTTRSPRTSLRATSLPRRGRVAPTLPTTVRSLDLRTGVCSTVKVTWSAINPESYATPGTFTVNGTANVTSLGSGKAATMTAVKATVEVT